MAKKVVSDFDLFGDEPAPSRRRRALGPVNPAAAGPSGPAMAGGPSGPAMSGGPSGPAMSGTLSAGKKASAKGDAKPAARRKRSMDDDTFKSLF